MNSRSAPRVITAVIVLLVTSVAVDGFSSPSFLRSARSSSGSLSTRTRLRRVMCPGGRKPWGAARAAPAGCLRMKEGGSGGEEGSEISDDDFKALLKRVADAKSNLDEIPILILDAMLPKQRLEFQTTDESFIKLVKNNGATEFGMLGIDGARRAVCPYGVVVELTKQKLRDEGNCMDVEFVAQRRFKLLGDPWQDPEGHYVCRIEYCDDAEDEATELEDGGDAAERIEMKVGAADKEADDAVSLELEELVEKWMDLVIKGKRERRPHHMAQVLRDLGDMPGTDSPRERAMWVGALINPIPALGVSLEIRPAILSAPTAGAALFVASEGIKSSIGHMDGSKPLW